MERRLATSLLFPRTPADYPLARRLTLDLLGVFIANHKRETPFIAVIGLAIAIMLSRWTGLSSALGWWACSSLVILCNVVFDQRLQWFADRIKSNLILMLTIGIPRISFAVAWNAPLILFWKEGVAEMHFFLLFMACVPLAVNASLSGPSFAIFVAESMPGLLSMVIACLREGGIFYNILAPGAVSYFAYMASTALFIHRAFIRYFVTQYELAEAKEQAEKGSKAKSQFLAVMSHEVRTPLNGILGMARQLLRSPMPAPQRERIETINESGNALLAILDDVLEMSRIEAGRLTIDYVDFDLIRLIEAIVALMSARAEEKGISLRLDTANNLPRYVRGDPARLRQVLLNLIGNAVKFTERGSVTIFVRPAVCEDQRGGVRFEVIDTGIGIAEDARGRMFSAFSQADSSVTRRYGGTGLGLAISYRLVEAMGGKIEFESAVGQGSRFWFKLAFTAAAAPKADEPAAQVTSTVPPLYVLAVEDIAVNRRVIEGYLTHMGHRVCLAGGGHEALALIAQNDFDIVLLDIQMPDIDGFALTRMIRALPDKVKSSLPIIATTANVMPEDRDACLKVGMQDVVAKPIEPKVLAQALARAWSKHGGESSDRKPGSAKGGEVPLFDRQRIIEMEAALGKSGTLDILKVGRTTLAATLEKLAQAWRNNEQAALRVAAHQISGTAGTIGLSALDTAVRKLSLMLRNGSPETIGEAVSVLLKTGELSLQAIDQEIAGPAREPIAV